MFIRGNYCFQKLSLSFGQGLKNLERGRLRVIQAVTVLTTGIIAALSLFFSSFCHAPQRNLQKTSIVQVQDVVKMKDFEVTQQKVDQVSQMFKSSIEKVLEGGTGAFSGYVARLNVVKDSDEWTLSLQIHAAGYVNSGIVRPKRRKPDHCDCPTVFSHTYYHHETNGFKKCALLGAEVEKHGMLAVFSNWKGLLISIDPNKNPELKPDDYAHLFATHDNPERLGRVCASMLAVMDHLAKKGHTPDQYTINWHIGVPAGTIDVIHTRFTGDCISSLYDATQCAK